MLIQVLGDIRVPRLGAGRARTRPDAVIADKAYGTKANRAHLRRRRITTVIPEKSNAAPARKKRGSRGGRPPAFDPELYKLRHTIENAFCDDKQWRALATRYDKLAIIYRAAVVIFAIITWLRT